MANKILENVKVGDTVELLTLKGDSFAGLVSMKDDDAEIIGLRKNGGAPEDRFSYSLVAGCSVVRSTPASTELGPAPETALGPDFWAVQRIAQSQGLSTLPEWNKIVERYRYAAKMGEFEPKYGRISRILAELTDIRDKFTDPSAYQQVHNFFKSIEIQEKPGQATPAAAGVGRELDSKTKAIANHGPTVSASREEGALDSKAKEIGVQPNWRPLTELKKIYPAEVKNTPSKEGQGRSPGGVQLSRPRPYFPAKLPEPKEMNGWVVHAAKDFKDPKKFHHWEVRTDDGENFWLYENNINDKALLANLRECFAQSRPVNERVSFFVQYYRNPNGEIRPKYTDVRRFGLPAASPSNDPADSEYRKAVQLFQLGKANDQKVLPVFLKQLKANPDKSIIVHLCTIYQRSDEPRKAIELVSQDKFANYLTPDQVLNIQYEAYKRMEESAQALAVQEKIINTTGSPENKAHHLNLFIVELFRGQEYEKTLQYCEIWFSNDIRKSINPVLVPLMYRQFCEIAAHCLVRLKHAGQAYSPSQAFLKTIKTDENAAAILAEEPDAPEYAFLEMFSEWEYMGRISKNLMNELSLISDSATNLNSSERREVINFETGAFIGKSYKSIDDSALEIAKKLTGGTAPAPRVQYDNCIFAARILYDVISNLKKEGLEALQYRKFAELEAFLFKTLAKAMINKGDYSLLEKEPEFCKTRFYYTEGIKYAAANADDRTGAIIRCLLSVFVDRAFIIKPILSGQESPIRAITKYLDDNENSAKSNIKLLLGVMARIFANVPPDEDETKNIQKALTSAVSLSKLHRDVLGVLCAAIGEAPQNYSNESLFHQTVGRFRKKYRDYENTFIKFINWMTGKACFNPEFIEEAHIKLAELEWFFEYIDDFDRENIREFLGKVLDLAGQVYQAGLYEEQEDYLKRLLGLIDERHRLIVEIPAQYSYEHLLPVLEKWQELARKRLDDLYIKNPPVIDCDIAGDGRVCLDDDDCVNVSFSIANKAGRQKVELADVLIEDREGVYGDTQPENIGLRTIKGGSVKYLEARLHMKTPENLQAFTVYVKVHYGYIGENGAELKGQGEFPLSAHFGEQPKVDLPNPYNVYANAAIIKEKSMMFGRDELITELTEKLRGHGALPLRRKALMLYGQKRAGKSTVIHHLREEMKEGMPDAIIVNIGDLSLMNTDRFEEIFYKIFFNRLKDELRDRHLPLAKALEESEIQIPSDDSLGDAADGRYQMGLFLTRMNNLISAKDDFKRKTVVMLFDEFTYLYIWLKKKLVDEEFMKYFKAMLNEYDLVAVAAAQDYIGEFISAYPNQFGTTEMIPIDYLSEEAVQLMVRTPFGKIADWEVFHGKAGDDAIKRIIELTAGSAFFTMIMLDRLVDYLNTANQPFVTPAVVDRVLKNEILSGNNPLALDKFESLYNDDGDISDPYRPVHNLVLLWAAARAEDGKKGAWAQKDIYIPPEVKIVADLNRDRLSIIVDKLVKRGVLNRTTGKDEYLHRVGMFKEWLLGNCGPDVINGYHESLKQQLEEKDKKERPA